MRAADVVAANQVSLERGVVLWPKLNEAGSVALGKFLITRLVRHGREYPFAVAPEAEQGAKSQADDVGTEVVGQGAGQAQDVVADVEASDGDGHCHAIEQEEQGQFAPHMRAPAVSESPVPIAEIRDQSGDTDTDDLRADGPVIHRTLATGKTQVVEQPDIDNKCSKSDETKFCNLAVQSAELIAKTKSSAHHKGPLIGRRH